MSTTMSTVSTGVDPGSDGGAGSRGSLVFGSNATITRRRQAGRAVRLAPSIYVVDSALPAVALARVHALEIIANVWPGAVISDRTALDGGRSSHGWMFIRHPDPARTTDLQLPGLHIAVQVGPGRLPGDFPLAHRLSLSGRARQMLENVTGRGRPSSLRPSRAAGTDAVLDRITELVENLSEQRYRALSDEVDAIAEHFSPTAVERVHEYLRSSWHHRPAPPTRPPRPGPGRCPADEHRLRRLQEIVDHLDQISYPPIMTLGGPQTRWKHVFEAYFSVVGPGAGFSVRQALQTTAGEFTGSDRRKALDLFDTCEVLAAQPVTQLAAHSGADLIEMVRDHHRLLTARRPGARPGHLRTTHHPDGVDPDLIAGTLVHGFDIVSQLPEAFTRAVALLYLIESCLPFTSANGRLAKLVANSELSDVGQCRLVVPSILWLDYEIALRAAQRADDHGESLLAVLRTAQEWTASIDWSSFDLADRQVQQSNAYLHPRIARASGWALRYDRTPFQPQGWNADLPA